MVAEAIEQQLDIQIDRRRVELGKPIKMVGTYEVPVSLYRDIKGTVTVVVGGGDQMDEESAETVEAFDEALEIAESPADETVEIDGQISEDGTVEAEVTEIEG